MWRFVDLNNSEKLERRRLLDLYGALAQISALVPLAVLQLYFLGIWLRRRWRRSGKGDGIPSSPHLKKRRSDSLGTTARVSALWRKTLWWAGDTVELLGFRVTKGEIVAAVVWTAWLILLCCVQTNGDYLHLTKRFGIVGASQLPLQYLLAFKSPFSPIHHLTGCSWETLNTAHQLLGRISTLLFYLHTGFYLNFFIQAHVLTKRIKDWDVILGLVGIVAFTAVGTAALSFIRRVNYRVFYTTHVTLATILLPVLYLHVHHIRIYIIETLVVYALHLVLRVLNEHKVSGSLTMVPGTADLLEINIPLPATKSFMQWQPGQHVYVSLDQGFMYMRSLKSRNPFTVASLPSEDGNLKLVARVLDGNTAALAKAATEGTTGKSTSTPLVIEGPYGLSTHPNTLLGYNRVLFIAGGVGATFVVPLYRTLLRDLSPSPGSRRRQNVAFVWTVRDAAETTWAVPEDEKEQQGMQERMTVYATRANGHDENEQKTTEDDDEGVELERLLPGGGSEGSTGFQGWQVHYGRPNLGEMVDKTASHVTEDTKVAIVVCGPKTMVDDVRRRTGKWIGKRDVWLHVESFGL